MARIKVRGVSFDGEYAFRKFQNLTVPIEAGITLICGHNGIGKSTILGLLASCSGIPTRAQKTYLGKTFNANIGEIIYIDFASEIAPRQAEATLAEPMITYIIGRTEFQKKVSLTKKKDAKRARSVPRSVPYKLTRIGDVSISKDSKVPLPTLYLGMVRMLPVGEVLESRVSGRTDIQWHADDKKLVQEFMGKIIKSVGKVPNATEITINHVLQTKKLAAHPSYDYSTRSVSVGQDSLGTIAAGLASFQRLKREMGDDYPGGLLIIDELDAGFHPRAIRLIVQELRRLSQELDLQIVATTHSTRLIEAVHPEGRLKAPAGSNKDRVVYLKDTQSPEYDASITLADILADMDIAPVDESVTPKLRLYFEDREAVNVFQTVTSKDVLEEIEEQHGIEIDPIALNIGCDSLVNLPKLEPYFKTVLLVADGDADVPSEVRNLIRLPSDGITIDNNKGPSPERTLLRFIQKLHEDQKAEHPDAWRKLATLGVKSRDRLDIFLEDATVTPASDRKVLKSWWKKNAKQVRAWGLYELWAEANPEIVTAYHDALRQAVRVANRGRRTYVSRIKLGEELDD